MIHATNEMSDEGPLLLGFEGSYRIEVPASINAHLRPYQRDGVQFLYSRYRENGGGILADDMGLGKTIQAIAFTAAVLCKTGGGTLETPSFLQTPASDAPAAAAVRRPPVLVVCPAAVLFNWAAELQTWTSLDTGLFVLNKRSEVLAAARGASVDVVLTSFEAARDHVTALNQVRWTAVIVDEVHRLKNPTSQTTRALSALVCRRRFGLSGTVVQNELVELWAVLDWANPGCLGGRRRFQETFAAVLERGRRRGALGREVAEAGRRRELLATLRQRWLLRRTKAAISDQLPNKTDQVVHCPLSTFQRAVYNWVLQTGHVRRLLRGRQPCQCGSGALSARCCLKQGDQDAATASVNALSVITLLLKICNHPYLMTPAQTSSAQQAALARQVCDSVFQRCPEFASLSRAKAFRALSHPKYSGKMQVLITLLERFRAKNRKALVFSYSTRMLKIIRAYASSQGFPLTYIDGDTAAAERPRLCAEFGRLPHWAVALVSTRAGGQGLNMTGASAVVVFDPSWNPAHDLQAQDRAYRLGQTQDVSVYRLVSAGAIEENVYLRQVYKQQLSTLVLEDGSAPRLFSACAGRHQGRLFGLENMLHLRDDGWLTETLVRQQKRLEKRLTQEAGGEPTVALPAIRTGEAGLPVSDYAPAAPACGSPLLPPDDVDEELGSADGNYDGVTNSMETLLRGCGVVHSHRHAPLVADGRTGRQNADTDRQRRGGQGTLQHGGTTVPPTPTPDSRSAVKTPAGSSSTAVVTPPRAPARPGAANTARRSLFGSATRQRAGQSARARDRARSSQKRRSQPPNPRLAGRASRRAEAASGTQRSGHRRGRGGAESSRGLLTERELPPPVEGFGSWAVGVGSRTLREDSGAVEPECLDVWTDSAQLDVAAPGEAFPSQHERTRDEGTGDGSGSDSSDDELPCGQILHRAELPAGRGAVMSPVALPPAFEVARAGPSHEEPSGRGQELLSPALPSQAGCTPSLAFTMTPALPSSPGPVPAGAEPVSGQSPAGRADRVAAAPESGGISGGISDLFTPSARCPAAAEPTTPPRATSSVDAFLERLLESPGRRPPPSRPRRFSASRNDPIQRWIREGKVYIAK